MSNKYQNIKDIEHLKPGYYVNCTGMTIDQWKETLDLFKGKGAPVNDYMYKIMFRRNMLLLGWNEKLDTVTGGSTPYWFGRNPVYLVID